MWGYVKKAIFRYYHSVLCKLYTPSLYMLLVKCITYSYTFQVSSLLDEKLRDELVEDVAEEYEEIREEYYESLKVRSIHWNIYDVTLYF